MEKSKNRNCNSKIKYSEKDLCSINLLNIQAIGFILLAYSSYILYVSTIEGIELINRRYYDIPDPDPTPDATGFTGAELLLFSQILLTYVSNSQYNNKLKDYDPTNIYDTIIPEYYFNLAGLFSLAGDLFGVIAAKSLYDHDFTAPIFGQ